MLRKTTAFTLVELLVVISIIALLIGILLPALGAAREEARKVASSTQLKGIHQSMVIFSQSNKGFYPGVKSDGSEVTTSDFNIDSTASGNAVGRTVRGRFEILLDRNMFEPSYMINPSETKEEWSTAGVTSANFSYTMLAIAFNGTPGTSLNTWIRNFEWRGTTSNSQAIVLGDRNTGANFNTQVSSVYTATNSGDWKGTVVYNDNHTKFESTHLLDVQYGEAAVKTADNIFQGEPPIQDGAALVQGATNVEY
jgi:prepilin-type N-terminal cleavage/methylation domain-containing protein